MGGIVTFPLGSLYHGTKFAVEGISEALSYEFGGFGGKVKIIEPGMIATDFAGRSFDFSNDESISEYQHMIKGLFAIMPKMSENASSANLVAEVIYEAATDGTDTLRYVVGEDAKQGIISRKHTDDLTYLKATKELFTS